MPLPPEVTVDLVRRTQVRIRITAAFDSGGSGATHVATEYRVRRVASPYVIVYDGEDWPLLTTDGVPAEGNFAVNEDGDISIDPGASVTLTNLLVADDPKIYGAP